MRRLYFLFITIALLCGTVAAFAGLPKTISYQGYLKNGTSPASGPVTMTFSLYSSTRAGSGHIWRETQPDVPVTNGIYSVQLGSASPGQVINAPFDVPYWLGVNINGIGELPLQPLTSTGYAFRAGVADNASVLSDARHNTKSGSLALSSNTSNWYNTAFGSGALRTLNDPPFPNPNSSAANNTAVGHESLATLVSGLANTGLGTITLYRFEGNLNSAVGFGAGLTNNPVTGDNNTFIGANATTAVVAISNATAIGAGAIVNQDNSIVLGTTGTKVGIGTSTPSATLDVVGDANISGTLTAGNLRATTFLSDSKSNIKSGTAALEKNIDGRFNTAFGTNALTNLYDQNAVLWPTYTANNTAVGYDSLASLVSGSGNSALGVATLYRFEGAQNSALGFGAGLTTNPTTGSNNTFIGANATTTAAAISNATAIGAGAVVNQDNSIVLGSTGTKVGIGISTPTAPLEVVGDAKISGKLAVGSLEANTLLSSSNGNTKSGTGALEKNIYGRMNTAFGTNALTNLYNPLAAFNVTYTTNNTAIGYDSLASLVSGSGNSALGVATLYRFEGAQNSAVGFGAGLTTNPVTGINNTFIGANATTTAAAISNATAIGAGAVVNQDNSIVLGSTVTKVGIGTSTPSAALDVVGDAALSGSLGFGTTTRQMLNLYGSIYAIGVQNYTLYSRSDSGFGWYRGGSHSTTQGDPGTNGTSLMNLDGFGNLNAAAQVRGNGTEGIAIYGVNTSTSVPSVEGWNQGSGDIFRGWSGVVGTTLSQKFTVTNNGTVWALNGYTQGSDLRLKTDIQTLEDTLAKVLNLRGVSYIMKADESKERKIGVIAQELEQEYPELVNTDDKGMKSVAYANLAAVLIEAVKGLKAENETLKARLEKIELLLNSK